jgi:histone acetyltransferase MYST1
VECDKLFVCERCLKYVRKRSTLARHEAKCEARHPPGKMIYEHKRSRRTEAGPGSRELVGADLAFWEIDGAKMKVYCQNLCLLAKLFLDHKTLYFDVEPFLFYVLTERDPETDTHVAVGYFSKEKASLEEYNLACILTLPPYQRRGYGSLLISMSYELSRREGKVGTPERPLSDLGLVSYRSYWCRVVLAELRRHKASLSLKDLSAATGFREADVASALTSLNLLKYWKGQHIVSATPKIVDDHLRSFGGPDALFAVNPEWVRWEPPAAAPAPANRKGGGDR